MARWARVIIVLAGGVLCSVLAAGCATVPIAGGPPAVAPALPAPGQGQVEVCVTFPPLPEDARGPAARLIPCRTEYVQVRITALDMEPIEATLRRQSDEGGTETLLLTVPPGPDRHFEITAKKADGTALASAQLNAEVLRGALTRLSIELAPDPENAVPVATVSGPARAYLNQPVTFVAAAADPDGAIVSQRWDFGDGATASGEEVTHAYSAPGTYTVTFVATDDDGIEARASTEITIDNRVERILFVGSDQGWPRLCLLDPATGEVAPLEPVESARGYAPAISPDGTKIACFDATTGELRVMEWNGSKLGASWAVTPPDTYVYEPYGVAFSPDGSTLAFAATLEDVDDDGSSLYLCDVSGANLRQVVDGVAGSCEQPSWAPDGSAIYFTRNNCALVCHIGPGGEVSEPEPVFAGADYLRWAALSPDGTKLAYTHANLQQAGVVRIDGSGDCYVSQGLSGLPICVCWSPRGKFLALSAQKPGAGGTRCDIFVKASDGSGEALRLTSDAPAIAGQPICWGQLLPPAR